MRRTFRLLASVKPARYLEAGTPTGLTGIYTHPSPRSTLLFLYSSTLDKLKAVPEHSVYRQSVEAVTKHRMAIVEAAVPPGYDEWSAQARRALAAELEQSKTRVPLAAELEKAEKALEGIDASTATEAEKARLYNVANLRKLLADLPEVPLESNIVLSATHTGDDTAIRVERGGQTFFIRHLPKATDVREEEWDGHFDPELQGIQTLKETKAVKEELEATIKGLLAGEKTPPKTAASKTWAPEPQWTADQISEIETKIGAGLIEEVVQVAEGELKLTDTMIQSKVWESLDERPAEGQWAYFERRT